MTIGYHQYGTGEHKVIILHDWFSDVSSYSALIPYLDQQHFTFIFADLRGYGKSKHFKGEYSVLETVSDILTLADELGFNLFSIIGHSMSGMTVQYLLAHFPHRIAKAIAIAPVPACGSPADKDTFDFMKEAADNDLNKAAQAANMMSGNRHSNIFIKYKAQQWHKAATTEARLGYLKMFTQTDFTESVQGCNKPLLVITGEYDIEAYNEQGMKNTIKKWFENAELKIAKNSAHYPMQEVPVWLATEIDNFLKNN
ncbi:alpha/beta fold hydrolase [Rickettsiales endosymbiont of Stachyamoeba lipophora]|uniref:alpha/beta fold hydrolase n=1 Tax=Rickettsiales endosymbiont of Stachyamoeba lipophora TaxID=2486578 RepID=UPI000F6560C1|nr:alpha/beta hydrolase [Rickettsiales endosymbiont of Stachyamoeba lipophora]AZL15446.1 alpha/beta hydrolase [Rickettsiales endosymbiont of Stachyamoeba lipophora]